MSNTSAYWLKSRETHCHRPISSPFYEGIWKGFPFKYVGILHLAVKYEVAFLRDQMIEVLRHAWPQYLFDWDYLQKRTEDLERIYLRRECFDLSFAHPEPGMSSIITFSRYIVLTHRLGN